MNPEDSMEPIKTNKSTRSIEPQSVKIMSGGDQVDRLLSQAINLSEGMVLHEPTCIICSSPARNDVEQKMLETKDSKKVIQLFKDLTGQDITSGSLENHMKFHHDRDLREHQKIEYIDRIKRYSGQNLTTLDRISICFAIVSERLMGVNSVIPADDESVAQIEKMKSSETVKLMGVLNGMLKLQAGILGEMKTSGELISIPANDFIQIINDALSEAQTDRERKLVKHIIDRFDALSRRAQ